MFVVAVRTEGSLAWGAPAGRVGTDMERKERNAGPSIAAAIWPSNHGCRATGMTECKRFAHCWLFGVIYLSFATAYIAFRRMRQSICCFCCGSLRRVKDVTKEDTCCTDKSMRVRCNEGRMLCLDSLSFFNRTTRCVRGYLSLHTQSCSVLYFRARACPPFGETGGTRRAWSVCRTMPARAWCLMAQ